MTHLELKNIIKEIKFNNSAMAECCGIVRTTFNRYLDGTAQIPPHIEQIINEVYQRNKAFTANADNRIMARIDKEYPNGFMSE